jgi:hypothetical protein
MCVVMVDMKDNENDNNKTETNLLESVFDLFVNILSNKYIRTALVFFAIFILLRGVIGTNKEIKTKKNAVIRRITSQKSIVGLKNESEKSNEDKIASIRARAERRAEERSKEEEKDRRIDMEFESKPDLKQRKIKVGDNVKFIMVVVDKNTNKYMQDINTIPMVISASDNMTNSFIGKRIGSVVSIPVAAMLGKFDFKKEIEKIQRSDKSFQDAEMNEYIRNFDFDKTLMQSPLLYKLKAVEFLHL